MAKIVLYNTKCFANHSKKGPVTTPAQPDEKKARDDLAFIRETMESAAGFTPVSGVGLMAVGIFGLVATVLAYLRNAHVDPLVWVPTAVVSIIVSTAATARKGKKLQIPLWTGSFQKMVWVMTPALVVGALMTLALVDGGGGRLIAATWLSLYGVGVTAGGTHTTTTFRWMGIAFIILGAIAMFNPQWGIWLLGIGFGGLHLAFGLQISRTYGG